MEMLFIVLVYFSDGNFQSLEVIEMSRAEAELGPKKNSNASCEVALAKPLAALRNKSVKKMAQRKIRFDLARVVSIWEVASGEIRELDIDEHRDVRCGALRVELYENAIVDFWTEAAAGLVHVDWVFGPSYGLGQTSRIRHRNGTVSLEEIGVRWES